MADIDVGKISEALNNKVDIGYGNTSPKQPLTRQNITNCITEIPQRINLELNDNTLTLKAGSQIIVPNGFEDDGVTPKFDYVTIDNDVVLEGIPVTDNIERFLVYNVTKNELRTKVESVSGANPVGSGSSKYILAYNTTTNKVGSSENSLTITYDDTLAFPIAKVVPNGSIIFSYIAQVFNGIGYIGSTVWVDKGVKGLIPDGKNDDGSLKNTEYTTSKLTFLTLGTTGASRWQININNDGDIEGGFETDYSYNSDENFNYKFTDKTKFSPVLSLYGNKDGISNFQPYHPVSINSLCDGQWVYKSLQLANNVDWTTPTTFDLSDYLPKDNNIYEVLFTGTVIATATVNKFCSIGLTTDIIKSNIDVCTARCTVATVQASATGNVALPVGTSRTVTQYKSSSTNASGTYTLWAMAYRRLGNNI